jgi:hypothetical protein
MACWWKWLCVWPSRRRAQAGSEPEPESFPDKATLDGLFQAVEDGRALATGFTGEQRRRLGSAERCFRKAIRTKDASCFSDGLCELRLALAAGVDGSTPQTR